MLPLEKQPGAYTITPRPKVPKIMANAPRIMYRILALSEDGNTATICSDMKKLHAGQLSVVDVDVSSLGIHSVKVGDILSYAAHDQQFQKPLIAHRGSQSHQHPKQLLAVNEA